MQMKKITFFNFIKGILFASLWIISLNMYTQNITVKGSVKDSKVLCDEYVCFSRF